MIGPNRLGGPINMECDVLIIGSGAGGACVADVLTKAGSSVLMIEEGPYVPLSSAPMLLSESIPQLWRSGGLTAALGRSSISYAEGRCVGGGTEINSGIFQEAPSELLDKWGASFIIKKFGAKELEKYYQLARKMLNVSSIETMERSSLILKEGAENLQYALKLLDRSVIYRQGAAGIQEIKQTMSETLIPDAIKRGMSLIAECKAEKLDIKQGAVRAVIAKAKDHEGRSHAVLIRPKKVFICAGAIQTPHLLLRSGITKNIGTSLSLHPTVKCTAIFDRRVDAYPGILPLYAVTEFMPDYRIGGSVFSPGTFGMALAEDWGGRSDLIKEISNAGLYYSMIRPKGSGTVSYFPGLAEPIVRFSLTDDDWRALALSVTKLGNIMFAAGAKRVYPSISGHPGWQSVGDSQEYLDKPIPRKKTHLMSIHLFSSCRPGEDRSRCATDSFGRVHGIENLIIADASQIPEAPGVNPQATIMALALRNAEASLN